ncbi:hypothetical protein JZ751_018317 [Albula glossodonta]|uniref:Uncharacterized protein n=1 Tax=Albula glossodonta TaxID=121402 RepID=A0A8T2NP29_9TELE|nr:hypothetical protein JZ751_018317 [Albula glossodonta]
MTAVKVRKSSPSRHRKIMSITATGGEKSLHSGTTREGRGALRTLVDDLSRFQLQAVHVLLGGIALGHRPLQTGPWAQSARVQTRISTYTTLTALPPTPPPPQSTPPAPALTHRVC